MARKFNYERAATVLADAVLIGDEAAARRWNVSVRSIELWRVRLNTDSVLAEFFAMARNIKQQDWIEELPEAIASGIKFLKRAGDEANYHDPEVITAVASGLKVLADIDTTRKIIDVQLQQLKSSAAAQGAYFNEGVAEGAIDTTAEEIK